MDVIKWKACMYSGTPPYDHLVITTISFLPRTNWDSSHSLSFTTPLFRPPRYYDHIFAARPKVVVLTRYRCTIIDWACGLRQGFAKQHDIFLRYHVHVTLVQLHFFWQAIIKISPPKQGLCSNSQLFSLLPCTPTMEKGRDFTCLVWHICVTWQMRYSLTKKYCLVQKVCYVTKDSEVNCMTEVYCVTSISSVTPVLPALSPVVTVTFQADYPEAFIWGQ